MQVRSQAEAPPSVGIYNYKFSGFMKRSYEEAENGENEEVNEEEYVGYNSFFKSRYFNAPRLDWGADSVLQYWKNNQFNFPILSAMARDYLTVQASSVSSERAFSSGTDLVTADRCSLSGKTIEKTQFLKYNM